MSIQLETLSPRELWSRLVRVIWYRKAFITFVFLTTVFSAYAYLQLLTERYSAEALLLVKLGRENTELPLTVARGSLTTLGVRKEEINSNVSLLSSRSLIEQVVNELGPATFTFTDPIPITQLDRMKFATKQAIRFVKRQYREAMIAAKLEKRLTPQEEAIEYCAKFLHVDRIKESDVISVVCTMPDPALAVRVEETLLKAYLERHVDVHSATLTKGFFEEQVANFRQQLESLDQKIIALRKQAQLSSVDHEQQLILARLHDLYRDQDERSDELSYLQSPSVTASRVEPSPTAADVPSPPSPPTIPLPVFAQTNPMDHLLDRYLERVRLTAFRGSHADTIDLQTIDNEISRLESQAMLGLESSLQRSKTHADMLEKRLEQLNESQVALQQLERDRSLTERNYFTYVERMENDRIARELDRSRVANVSVLAVPAVSPQPVYPKKKLIMVAALVGGLALAIGAALLLEYLDDTIRATDDITDISLPVLGSIHARRALAK